MPDPASADFIGTGRFGFNNQAATRREMVNGGDLLKDRSVPPKKLSRDAFPPDIRPGPSGEKPSWHDEPGKDAHEKGVPRSVDDPARLDRVARDDHNHDFTYQRVGMVQTIHDAPSDYVAPFYDAGEGPHPAALPGEYHKRIANWSVYPDYADRIKGGPIEVWAQVSVDGGTTWREPVLRAVAPPGSISAEYEDRDVDWDPATYAQAPQVRIYVRPVNHDKDPALKVVRAGVDGKIDEDWLPVIEAFPVGSVFIAVVSTDPATLLGYGTWAAFGAGRVLVGLNSGDTDFDTVEETGGAKTATPSGSVSQPTFTGDAVAAASSSLAANLFAVDETAGGKTPSTTATGTVSQPTFTGVAHSIVQPYIVVYMWKRTA